jgi:hypothetical protein
MSDQTQPISDEDGGQFANAAKNKLKNKGGKAVLSGVAAGLAAVSYDAYASVDSSSSKPTSEVQAPDLLVAESKDSTGENKTKDSVSVQSQFVPDVVSTTSSTGVTLIPDHMNVGNAPDELSFEQAFQMCRENLGPAAVFEWRGELYHTCHPSEYAALSQATKDIFSELWFENAFLEPDWIPSEGNMSQVVVEYPETTPQLADAAANTIDPKVESIIDELFESTDSLQLNTPTDIVYTVDDFDNDFDGKDEWINPEDIIA